MAHILIKFKRDIERGIVSPLPIMGIVPLCSSQYHRLFGTTRRPGKVEDTLLHYDGAESDYCVCCCGGRWFKVSITSPGGRVYTPAEMERLFELVVGCKDEVGPGEEYLPALTTLKRNEWAEVREVYFVGGVNQVSMEIIEKVIPIFSPSS